jgi:hypothetical protein
MKNQLNQREHLVFNFDPKFMKSGWGIFFLGFSSRVVAFSSFKYILSASSIKIHFFNGAMICFMVHS